ncbi:MAG: hypothetical protein ACYDBH_22920, partial [Acidobacteriaceae bacterium]
MFAPKMRYAHEMPAKFSRGEKRIIRGLAIVAVLARVPLAFRSIPNLAGFPYGDDAFYMLSVARHLAAGQGLSVDGHTLTNGFQPLLVMLYTPIFWLCGSNAWLAVRWTFILNGVIAGLCVWSVAVLLRTMERSETADGTSAPVIGAALWTFTYAIFIQLTNGLETGLASLLIVLGLIWYARLWEPTPPTTPDAAARPPWWQLGAILGLAVLARIDTAILVAIIVGMLFLRKAWRGAIVTGIVAFLISLPWWIFNWMYFGSLMPTSGQAENSWPLPPHENIYRATQAISDILSLVFYAPSSLAFFPRILWLLFLAGGVLWLVHRRQ